MRRDLAVVAAAALALVLPFALVAPRGVGHVGWLVVRRSLHVESLGGSILLAAHRLGVYTPTSTSASAAPGTLRGRRRKQSRLSARWRRRRRSSRCGSSSLAPHAGPRELLLAVAAAVVGFVSFGKVLSPQYLVWVAAAVPLALGRVRPCALIATVAAAIPTRYVYDVGYDDLLRAGRVSWVMPARNVVLVGVRPQTPPRRAAPRRRNAHIPRVEEERFADDLDLEGLPSGPASRSPP